MTKISAHIIRFIDFFYPLFKRIMPRQTFRYAFCGATTTVLGLAMYYISFFYISDQQNFDIGFFVLKPHNAALVFSCFVSFTLGFFFMKYVVFVESNLRGKVQLVRYLVIYCLNFCINYFLLKLLVEIIQLPAMFSEVLITFIMIVVSYLGQKYFSFRIKKGEPFEDEIGE